jgi:transposase
MGSSTFVAGKPPATFDAAGTGDVAWLRYSGTRRRKSEKQRTQTSTYIGAPVLDPTCEGLWVKLPRSTLQAFRNSTHANAAQAAILFDKFHVMKHLGEALDKIRKAEYARLRGKQRQFIGQKYTLLSHPQNLTGTARKNLKLLLAANKRLNTAYLLKESFGQLWDYNREPWARKFFENWRASLKWQRLKPYEKFADMIERHWDGIAAYCQPENKVALGFVEGLNNKIRVMQRRAYGLRDEEYLRLKVLTSMLPQI